MRETWKDIDDFPAYKVSTLGRVKRVISGQGTTSGFIKPYLDSKGQYLRVSLLKNGISTVRSLHRLVATTFLPNPQNLPEVNHKKKPKTNCKVSNLEWRSRLGNSRHAVVSGFKGTGVAKLFGKWRARYYPSPGKRKHLGMFSTKEEAIKARKAAIKSIPRVV